MRWRSGERATWRRLQRRLADRAGQCSAALTALPLSARRLVNEEYKVWKKNTPFLYGEQLGRTGGGGGQLAATAVRLRSVAC